MKNKTIFLWILVAVLSTASSCKKDDNSSSGSSTSANISGIITSGTWRISYYHESGDDHTTDFNGYVFTFGNSGTMTATNSFGTATGTWDIDDSNPNEFHMSIGSTSPLIDINNGWLIISQTGTEIHMKDDDTSHSEELHLIKI